MRVSEGEERERVSEGEERERVSEGEEREREGEGEGNSSPSQLLLSPSPTLSRWACTESP